MIPPALAQSAEFSVGVVMRPIAVDPSGVDYRCSFPLI